MNKMKSENLIKMNLTQKIALFKSGSVDNSLIRAQIIMLDWVLSKEQFVRDIGKILKEY